MLDLFIMGLWKKFIASMDLSSEEKKIPSKNKNKIKHKSGGLKQLLPYETLLMNNKKGSNLINLFAAIEDTEESIKEEVLYKLQENKTFTPYSRRVGKIDLNDIEDVKRFFEYVLKYPDKDIPIPAHLFGGKEKINEILKELEKEFNKNNKRELLIKEMIANKESATEKSGKIAREELNKNYDLSARIIEIKKIK